MLWRIQKEGTLGIFASYNGEFGGYGEDADGLFLQSYWVV